MDAIGKGGSSEQRWAAHSPGLGGEGDQPEWRVGLCEETDEIKCSPLTTYDVCFLLLFPATILANTLYLPVRPVHHFLLVNPQPSVIHLHRNSF